MIPASKRLPILARLAPLLLFAGLTPLTASGSGTIVIGGGDPIFEFLEATRASFIETVNKIHGDPREADLVCHDIGLTETEAAFCNRYVRAIALDLLRSSRGTGKVPFVLRAEALTVIGPDGRPMPVAARTALGSGGPVEFHRESMRLMAPAQTLFLLAHEMQHKVVFEGKFPGDNEPAGPFAFGRDLLDAAAKSIVRMARRHRLIGTQFGIQDQFDCQFLIGNDLQAGSMIAGSRMFMDEELMSYETSLGRRPGDLGFYLPETLTTQLSLRVRVLEPANCDPQRSEGRSTTLEIERRWVNALNEVERTEIIATEVLPINPVCQGVNSRFEIATGASKFRCRYMGSTGSSNSSLRLPAAALPTVRPAALNRSFRFDLRRPDEKSRD